MQRLIKSLLLATTALFQCKMNCYTRQEIVISDSVAVLEEDSVVRNLLLRRRHFSFFLNLLLKLLNRVAKADVHWQGLSIQLPFRFVRQVGDLNLNCNRALKGFKGLAKRKKFRIKVLTLWHCMKTSSGMRWSSCLDFLFGGSSSFISMTGGAGANGGMPGWPGNPDGIPGKPGGAKNISN